ncbi:unnamed protein product [Rotaria socialis]
MWYEVDIVTVYFFVWQFVSLIYKWLNQDLSYLSHTVHQKATCLSMAFLTFLVYDVLLRLMPTYLGYVYLWLMSVLDIITSLHPIYGMYDPVAKSIEDAVSFDYPTAPYGFYFSKDINELNDDVEYKDEYTSIIGWGDFFAYDLLLLLVASTNSSITIRACIAFGCIISVQLGDICTRFIDSKLDSNGLPGVPLPTIFVSGYAIAVKAIIEYLNLDC